MGVSDIIKGHINEAIGANEDLSKNRLEICRKCKLYKKASYGEICNNNLFLNPETDEVSVFPKQGFYKGCGCRLAAKTTLSTAHCPAKKW